MTMQEEQRVKDYIIDILNEDYSNVIYTSRLYDMFSKHTEAIESYIKPNRDFWYYDGEKGNYHKLKVTYVRSGVMFFVFEDEPNTEHAWFIGSFNCCSLYAAQIYPYEIGKLLSEYYANADKEFPEICKQCQWYDCKGRINVKVIWDE